MANGQYNTRIIGKKIAKEYTPFALVPYNRATPEPVADNPNWMVANGICYSTFSYDSGSYVPIVGLNTPFLLEDDSVVYLDFTILPNLQVSGASLKVGKVGKDSPNAANDKADKPPATWVDYPDFYRIRPFDQTKDGKVIKLIDGKKQQNCYLMIGKCFKNLNTFITNDDVMPYTSTVITPTGAKPALYFVQYCYTDIILMGSHVSGVPVIFPMPYFGGPATSDKAQLIFK